MGVPVTFNAVSTWAVFAEDAILGGPSTFERQRDHNRRQLTESFRPDGSGTGPRGLAQFGYNPETDSDFLTKYIAWHWQDVPPDLEGGEEAWQAVKNLPAPFQIPPELAEQLPQAESLFGSNGFQIFNEVAKLSNVDIPHPAILDADPLIFSDPLVAQQQGYALNAEEFNKLPIEYKIALGLPGDQLIPTGTSYSPTTREFIPTAENQGPSNFLVPPGPTEPLPPPPEPPNIGIEGSVQIGSNEVGIGVDENGNYVLIQIPGTETRVKIRPPGSPFSLPTWEDVKAIGEDIFGTEIDPQVVKPGQPPTNPDGTPATDEEGNIFELPLPPPPPPSRDPGPGGRTGHPDAGGPQVEIPIPPAPPEGTPPQVDVTPFPQHPGVITGAGGPTDQPPAPDIPIPPPPTGGPAGPLNIGLPENIESSVISPGFPQLLGPLGQDFQKQILALQDLNFQQLPGAGFNKRFL